MSVSRLAGRLSVFVWLLALAAVPLAADDRLPCYPDYAGEDLQRADLEGADLRDADFTDGGPGRGRPFGR